MCTCIAPEDPELPGKMTDNQSWGWKIQAKPRHMAGPENKEVKKSSE